MPTFDTPTPITLRFNVPAGTVRIEASRRTDTTVEVRPRRENRTIDVETAQQTIVEQTGDGIVIEVPDERRIGRTGEIRVVVGLPEDSSVDAQVASADVQTTGTLGAVTVTTASGDVKMETVGTASVKTASGDVRVGLIDGDAQVTAASADVTIDRITGAASVTTASGDALIGDVTGDLTLNTASGDGVINSVGGSVESKSASGDVAIRKVTRGQVRVNTTSGDLTIGVAEGTAAWLELSSMSGDVRSELAGADDPGTGETVEIRARSLSGDIRIKKAK